MYNHLLVYFLLTARCEQVAVSTGIHMQTMQTVTLIALACFLRVSDILIKSSTPHEYELKAQPTMGSSKITVADMNKHPDMDESLFNRKVSLRTT